MAHTVDELDIRDTNGYELDITEVIAAGNTLIRVLNDLDSEVHVSMQGTSEGDTSLSYGEALPVGGDSGDPDANTMSVGAGSVESTYLTEPWELVRTTVTAQSNPSSGTLVLEVMGRGLW